MRASEDHIHVVAATLVRTKGVGSSGKQGFEDREILVGRTVVVLVDANLHSGADETKRSHPAVLGGLQNHSAPIAKLTVVDADHEEGILGKGDVVRDPSAALVAIGQLHHFGRPGDEARNVDHNMSPIVARKVRGIQGDHIQIGRTTASMRSVAVGLGHALNDSGLRGGRQSEDCTSERKSEFHQKK